MESPANGYTLNPAQARLVGLMLYGLVHDYSMTGVPFDELTPDEMEADGAMWGVVLLLRDMQAKGVWQETARDREAWLRYSQD